MPGNPYYQSPHWRALRKAALERDRHRCVVAGCGRRATFVDHIRARPPVAYACAADTLANTRSLCASHDAQCKERSQGSAERRQGGEFIVRGCDAGGWPIDPARR